MQQSSVEWASSLWLNVVQEVDPGFTRTVFVASKFDNRLKEFAERWEVDKYLAATGYLPSNVRPFFVALPKVRSAVIMQGDRMIAVAAPLISAEISCDCVAVLGSVNLGSCT